MSVPVIKAGIDVAGVGAILGAFIGFLPAVATILAVVWYLLQIYESKAIQDFLGKRALRRQAEKAIALPSPEPAPSVILRSPEPQAPSPAAPEPAKPA